MEERSTSIYKLIRSTVPKENGIVYVGPYRVLPGRLSVSRTFGDIEAKYPNFGGISGVVIAEPEIKSFRISNDIDFLVMGSNIL
jgi:protein phosphatase 2C family protein 2/3